MERIRKIIDKYTSFARKNAQDYGVIMVCNVKGKTVSLEDYDQTPIDSEYYSYTQYEEIIDAVTKIGFSVKSYFDENDFISAYYKKELIDNSPKKLVILNSAQKGTAEGRKSLVPAFCDLNNLLHTNSNAYTSSFSRDKYHCFSVLRTGGYNVAESWLYDANGGWLFNRKPSIGKKLYVN